MLKNSLKNQESKNQSEMSSQEETWPIVRPCRSLSPFCKGNMYENPNFNIIFTYFEM